jgi:hypothetical protein
MNPHPHSHILSRNPIPPPQKLSEILRRAIRNRFNKEAMNPWQDPDLKTTES